MKQGELDNAIRRALNIFDAWNDVTGAVQKHAGIYYELQSIIEDAVHCGAQAATGEYHQLEIEQDMQPSSIERTIMRRISKASIGIYVPNEFRADDELKRINAVVISLLMGNLPAEVIINRLMKYPDHTGQIV